MTADEHGMYGRRAAYYDPIYHFKRYESESTRLHELLQEEGVEDGAAVVEAACGTGEYLQHLRRWYDVSGFDLSPAMIEVARRKLPEVPLFVADLADFTLPRPAGALLCLFSSIGYVYPQTRLQAAARCCASAVAPGGVLLVEPWLSPDVYRTGHLAMQTYEDERLKLCRAGISQREGDLSVFNFHWLAVREGEQEVEHFTDRHVLWLCPRATMIEAFEEAGFACRFVPEGLMSDDRGLLIGRRQPV